MRAADRWETSFRSQLGQFEWNVVRFGLKGASSLLMRVMNQALTVGLGLQGGQATARQQTAELLATNPPRPDRAHGGVPGSSGPLGRLLYMDDCLVHSPTMEQRLLHVAEVLEIFRRRQLYAKRSQFEFGRQELGFLGHRLCGGGARCSPSSNGRRRVVFRGPLGWPTRSTGLALHWAGQLLPALGGRLRRGRGALDGPRQPQRAFHVDPEAKANIDALKLALSSAPVLHTFEPARRGC